MSESINVALVGLGRIGGQFATSLAAHIEKSDTAIKIVAIAERNPDSALAKQFASDGMPVFTDALEIADLGEKVDIIFDLTGIPDTRQALRNKLREMNNNHTVLVPEVFVRMLWSFLGEGVALAAPLRTGY
jgi:homoserine dehydrogenase